MPIAFEKINFEKYFDHIIEYPILFAARDKNYIEPNGQSFKDFILGNFSKNLMLNEKILFGVGGSIASFLFFFYNWISC